MIYKSVKKIEGLLTFNRYTHQYTTYVKQEFQFPLQSFVLVSVVRAICTVTVIFWWKKKKNDDLTVTNICMSIWILVNISTDIWSSFAALFTENETDQNNIVLLLPMCTNVIKPNQTFE